MTEADVHAWLEAYRHAWESRDPQAAAALFTPDALYCETPYSPPAYGPDGVRAYWAAATGAQRDVAFRYELLALVGQRGLARWWAEFTRSASGVRVRLDGIFLLDFAADGRCRQLLEWWHRDERPRQESEAVK